MAAVPELSAAAWPMPAHAATSRSKASTCGPERRDPVGAERLLDEGGFLIAQVRRRQPDALRQLAPQHDVDRPAGAVDNRQVVDLVLIEQRDGRRQRRLMVDRDGSAMRKPADHRAIVDVFERGAPQVAISERAQQAAVRREDQQDAATSLIEALQRVVHRARHRDAQGPEFGRVHLILRAGTPA